MSCWWHQEALTVSIRWRQACRSPDWGLQAHLHRRKQGTEGVTEVPEYKRNRWKAAQQDRKPKLEVRGPRKEERPILHLLSFVAMDCFSCLKSRSYDFNKTYIIILRRQSSSCIHAAGLAFYRIQWGRFFFSICWFASVGIKVFTVLFRLS